MSKLWKKTRDASNTSDLEEVKLSELTISKPTVIYLPGRDQTDNKPKEISKGIHFVNKFFAELPSPPQVYMWSNNNKYSLGKGVGFVPSLIRVAAYSYFPDRRTGTSSRNLAKKLIMPLVTDAQGKTLPLEQAEKNLRNLTFLSYCLGSVAAQEINNASLKMMTKAGYTKEEAHQLMREIVHVSFATFTRPKAEDDRYTTLSFVNNDDQFLRAKNLMVLPLNSVVSLSKSFLNTGRKLEIASLSDTSMLVSATAMARPLSRLPWQKPKEVIDDVTLPSWKILDIKNKKLELITNHTPDAYVNDNPESNQFAGMVQCAMINAVTRKKLIRPVDLLNAPDIEHKVTDALFRGARKFLLERIFK